MTTIVQRTHISIVSFNNVCLVLLEVLSECPNLSISDVHWTPPFIGCYKLIIDATNYIDDEDIRRIGVEVRNVNDVVVALAVDKIISFSDFW